MWQNDPWIVEDGGAQANVEKVTGNIRSAHASIGKLKADWNDGSAETGTSDRKLNFARIKIATADGREYPDLWYFGDGVTVPDYPSVENMTASVLPTKWAQGAGDLSWAVVSGTDKVKATPDDNTGAAAGLKALAGSGQRNDCKIEVTSAQYGLSQRLKFDVESFGQAQYFNLARGNFAYVYQTTLIYTVPTKMGRFKKRNLSAREIFKHETRTIHTAKYPNCTWGPPNNGQPSPPAFPVWGGKPPGDYPQLNDHTYYVFDKISPSAGVPAATLHDQAPTGRWVDTYQGSWRIGAAGNGTVILDNKWWVRYRDRGTHLDAQPNPEP